MKIKYNIETQYQCFYLWLNQHLNDACLSNLKSGHVVDDSTLTHWLSCIDETGHIEIAGQYSKSGRPVTGDFPQYANQGDDVARIDDGLFVIDTVNIL